MPLIILFAWIAVLVFLIIKKIHPALALLVVTMAAGLSLGLGVTQVFGSVTSGIGSTLGSTLFVIAIGAMLGKLAESSGAAQAIVLVMQRWFGTKNIQWAVLFTGILTGIPLFYNAGFVVLIPLVFAIAAATGLPLLYVGIPMAASLSVTHGFLPPHPGPVALSGIFFADIGRTLLYGLILAIPISIIAGIFFPRMIMKVDNRKARPFVLTNENEKPLPSTVSSFAIVLMPVVLMAAGTMGTELSLPAQSFFKILQEPMAALLISLLITLLLIRKPMPGMIEDCAEGVKSIALIMLIIAAGGAFKQVLVDSSVAEQIKMISGKIHLSPLLLGWLAAAMFRITLGSATVAGLTAAGIVAPFITGGVSPELMVLSVGSGSLMCSHVNDTGFWMFKEYFGLSLQETFKTWTLMESIISVLGLAGVFVLDRFV